MIRKPTIMQGFTLFEILVAVSIFAVLGAITMTSLVQVARSGERISQAQLQLSEIQFALGYIGKDLAQLVNRKVRDQYGDEQNQFSLTENVLVFTRSGWANLLQQNRSQLQRVAYRLVDKKLVREYWLHLDQGYSEQRVTQTLLNDVEELEFRLITTDKDKLESWPAEDGLEEEQTKYPVAIELSVELIHFGLVRRIFEVNNVFL